MVVVGVEVVVVEEVAAPAGVAVVVARYGVEDVDGPADLVYQQEEDVNPCKHQEHQSF